MRSPSSIVSDVFVFCVKVCNVRAFARIASTDRSCRVYSSSTDNYACCFALALAHAACVFIFFYKHNSNAYVRVCARAVGTGRSRPVRAPPALRPSRPRHVPLCKVEKKQ